jgi:hypothetical protein
LEAITRLTSTTSVKHVFETSISSHSVSPFLVSPLACKPEPRKRIEMVTVSKVFALSGDLRSARLTDDRIIPVHSSYDELFIPTSDYQRATLVIVGPFVDDGIPNQYLKLDLTGHMNLHDH